MGIELAYHDINCPLFAEDIVLGKTKAEFQDILNITADFATEWNLKFNSDKSKLMVIGKRIDHYKEWALCFRIF